ncbi:hypothetical protein CAC42_660 [Sphaceloma murrayae]|uniref:Uncharacterized protein n=1 Tax=Sphaceloma murrayae TaxID=2082308 RepID=A0A2K1QKC9_9PEZI|nr:hypothetical protein CAC42_660 [Sphaceloma murrayae]
MADSASVSSASTRLTSTTTIVSTRFLTQTVTIPNPTGASLSTTLIPTGTSTGILTSTIEMKPSQTYLPPSYHLDPNVKEAIAPGPTSNKAAIAGGVTGTISAVAAIGIVAFLFWKRRRTPKEVTEEKTEIKKEKPYMPRKSVTLADRRSFVQL